MTQPQVDYTSNLGPVKTETSTSQNSNIAPENVSPKKPKTPPPLKDLPDNNKNLAGDIDNNNVVNRPHRSKSHYSIQKTQILKTNDIAPKKCIGGPPNKPLPAYAPVSPISPPQSPTLKQDNNSNMLNVQNLSSINNRLSKTPPPNRSLPPLQDKNSNEHDREYEHYEYEHITKYDNSNNNNISPYSDSNQSSFSPLPKIPSKSASITLSTSIFNKLGNNINDIKQDGKKLTKPNKTDPKLNIKIDAIDQNFKEKHEKSPVQHYNPHKFDYSTTATISSKNNIRKLRAKSITSAKSFTLWNCNEVRNWVENINKENDKETKENYIEYAQSFYENKIKGNQLENLTSDDLKGELNIHSLMHRKQILKSIQQLIGYQQKAILNITTTTICIKCNHNINNNDYIRNDDGYYHYDCFICDNCHKNLGGQLYAQFESGNNKQCLIKHCDHCLEKKHSN